MTETRWAKAIELLRQGRTVHLDDGCKIVPYISELGAAYSLRSDRNCVIYTPDLDRIHDILFWKPRRRN